jgi:predicted transcriptional regulator of viral defense system
MDDDMLFNIYQRPDTVMTFDEIAQLFPDISYKSLKDRLFYFTKTGRLKRLRRGIYAKAGYNPLELGNKLYKPAYISLETVLFKGGAIFQTYETIFLVSYLTRSVTVDGTEFQYRKIKDTVLTNMSGVESNTGYHIATLERAFLDAVYVYRDYHFDNLEVINWEKAHSLKRIYQSLAFEKRVGDYYKSFKEEHG